MGVVENRIDIMELMKGGGSGGGTAASVSYDNTVSHLSAATVQAALDEINADVVEGLALVNTSISSIRGAITGLGQGITGTRTMIAPIEDGETSSAAYDVGDQLIYNNLLYKVTSAISIGDTITPGTNVANADNVTEQIDEKAGKDQISNKNLLDNPWFTVNQRGATTYNTVGYTVDRWRTDNHPSATGSISVTVSIDGVTITNSDTTIQQFFAQELGGSAEEIKKYNGRTLTVSVLMQDGTLYKGSATFNAGSSIDVISASETENTFKLRFNSNNATRFQFVLDILPTKTVAIRAIKLELGSVSTLALDTAPNYATELLKCQRYFYRITGVSVGRNFFGFGMSTSTTAIQVPMILPVAMRTTPSIVIGGNAAYFADGSAADFTSTTGAVNNLSGNTIRFTLNNSGETFTLGKIYQVGLAVSTNNYIDLSADL